MIFIFLIFQTFCKQEIPNNSERLLNPKREVLPNDSQSSESSEEPSSNDSSSSNETDQQSKSPDVNNAIFFEDPLNISGTLKIELDPEPLTGNPTDDQYTLSCQPLKETYFQPFNQTLGSDGQFSLNIPNGVVQCKVFRGINSNHVKGYLVFEEKNLISNGSHLEEFTHTMRQLVFYRSLDLGLVTLHVPSGKALLSSNQLSLPAEEDSKPVTSFFGNAREEGVDNFFDPSGYWQMKRLPQSLNRFGGHELKCGEVNVECVPVFITTFQGKTTQKHPQFPDRVLQGLQIWHLSGSNAQIKEESQNAFTACQKRVALGDQNDWFQLEDSFQGGPFLWSQSIEHVNQSEPLTQYENNAFLPDVNPLISFSQNETNCSSTDILCYFSKYEENGKNSRSTCLPAYRHVLPFGYKRYVIQRPLTEAYFGLGRAVMPKVFFFNQLLPASIQMYEDSFVTPPVQKSCLARQLIRTTLMELENGDLFLRVVNHWSLFHQAGLPQDRIDFCHRQFDERNLIENSEIAFTLEKIQ